MMSNPQTNLKPFFIPSNLASQPLPPKENRSGEDGDRTEEGDGVENSLRLWEIRELCSVSGTDSLAISSISSDVFEVQVTNGDTLLGRGGLRQCAVGLLADSSGAISAEAGSAVMAKLRAQLEPF
ncbi:hypothetical protein Droror1_Dr00008471 [Drosera rotundifolia]